jgi:hypothetical protein
VATKFAAHVERKHAAPKAAVEAGADAPASDHADFVANVVNLNAVRQAKNAKAAAKPAPAKVEAAAKAAAKGDGGLKIVRPAGPHGGLIGRRDG